VGGDALKQKHVLIVKDTNYALHKITQGSINRLWTELVREYLMPPMYFEKHYPYSKLNVYDKLFVFSIPI
jgi:hypothetical protein